MIHRLAVSAAILLLLSAASLGNENDSVTEKIPDGVAIGEIRVAPERLSLSGRFDYRQLLITGMAGDGQTVDLTRMATIVEKPDFVDVSPGKLVAVRGDGEGEIRFQANGKSFSVPVSVRNFSQKKTPGFIRDVQPVLSRLGCNAGTCHGAKDGKGGFKLSLRGYDSIYDYRGFTDDLSARRINRVAPDQSLMLLKASGSIPHVGGQLTQPGEPYYEIIRDWIASGVPYDRETPRVNSIEIFPKNPILPRANLKQQITVTATYSDGSKKDVTREAFVESGNIEIIKEEKGGVVSVLRRGEAPVLVRFEGAYAATTLTVMGDRSGFSWKQPEEFNYIDGHVYDKLERMKILPSELCTDDEFCRRVHIDITGLPPTPEQLLDFRNDKRPSREKRDALIDDLVGNRAYVEHWTNKWADMLQVNRKFLGEEGSIALRNWIKQQIASNRPYDEFAREVLTASGSNLENPPASYYKVLRDPADIMENTTHLFLSVRFNCNKCHDHPFERWTQDQYYNLAAYFAQVGRKEDAAFAGKKIGGTAVEGAKPLVEVIFDRESGEVKHDRTGQVVAPATPYVHSESRTEGLTRREQLADWMTSSKNQYFARSYVNRLWGYLFGTGIIDPIDDIRAGNPPTNPQLLDALEKDFIESGFDVQRMVKTICKSRTYQHSIRTNRWNVDDTINYSHSIPRRLPAEVLYDSIHAVTGSMLRINGVPVGFRAAELPDSGLKVPFLDDFGKPVRESVCECERSGDVLMKAVMKLVNGPTVDQAISNPSNAITRMVSQVPDDRELIRKLYQRILCRDPSDQEINDGIQFALATPGADYKANAEKLAEYEKSIPARQAEWEKTLVRNTAWQTVQPRDFQSDAGATFEVGKDNSVFVAGQNGHDNYRFQVHSDLKNVTGIKLEALQDKRLPKGGPGRAENGNFVLSELKLFAAPKKDPSKRVEIKLVRPSASFSQEGWAIAGTLDGNPATGWAVSPRFNQSHSAIFETGSNAGFDQGTIFSFEMLQRFPDKTHQLGKFRLSFSTSPRPLKMKPSDPKLAELVAIPVSKRNAGQAKEMRDRYLKTDRTYEELKRQVELSKHEMENKRLVGVQDLAWALINSPSFLFNR
ncbi:MAG: DUF1549 and DUF1553 domain-containing protein [Planctomycetota bacterium]|nr:DUF1549 and DUF1553 domain-containing protein [Planctomycetota bacterium]